MNKQEIIELIKGTATATFILPGLGETTIPTVELKPMVESWENQLTNGWIPVTERLPETYRKVDGDSVYSVSNDVLCSAYNEDTAEYETWVDYTCDGEWQTHEYYEGEKLAWQPLPEPYKEVSE